MLFVSYARKDQNRIQPVITYLKEAGYNLWIDRSNLPGSQNWEKDLIEGLKTCDVLLFFMTANSVESEWCGRERMIARHNDVPVIPVRLDDVDTPADIQPVNWIDLREESDYVRLIRALNNLAMSRLKGDTASEGNNADTATFRTDIRDVHTQGGSFVIGNNYTQQDDINKKE